jgi:hypothetical protein
MCEFEENGFLSIPNGAKDKNEFEQPIMSGKK